MTPALALRTIAGAAAGAAPATGAVAADRPRKGADIEPRRSALELALFEDGFESGGVAAWSLGVR